MEGLCFFLSFSWLDFGNEMMSYREGFDIAKFFTFFLLIVVLTLVTRSLNVSLWSFSKRTVSIKRSLFLFPFLFFGSSFSFVKSDNNNQWLVDDDDLYVKEKINNKEREEKLKVSKNSLAYTTTSTIFNGSIATWLGTDLTYTNGDGSPANNGLNPLSDGDRSIAGGIRFTPNQNISGKVIYSFTTLSPVIIDELRNDQVGLSENLFVEGSRIKLQAMVGGTWTDISAPHIVSGTTLNSDGVGTAVKTNVDIEASQFRLMGISGAISAGEERTVRVPNPCSWVDYTDFTSDGWRTSSGGCFSFEYQRGWSCVDGNVVRFDNCGGKTGMKMWRTFETTPGIRYELRYKQRKNEGGQWFEVAGVAYAINGSSNSGWRLAERKWNSKYDSHCDDLVMSFTAQSTRTTIVFENTKDGHSKDSELRDIRLYNKAGAYPCGYTDKVVGDDNSTILEEVSIKVKLTCDAIKGTETQDDLDADGVNNHCDLDDDNDGILDVDEGFVEASNCVESQNGTYYFMGEPTSGNSGWTNFKETQITNGDSSVNVGISSNTNFFMQPRANRCGVSGTPYNIVGTSIRGTQDRYTFTFDEPVTDIVVFINDIAGGWQGPCGYETVRFDRPIEVIRNCGLIHGSTTVTGTCSNVGASSFIRVPGTYTTFTMTVDNRNASSCNCENYFIAVGVQGYGDCSTGGTVQTRDTDNDSIPDHLDLDSDNDGIYDIVEAGIASLDVDNDGRIDNMNITSVNIDVDEDGLADSLEAVNGADNGTTPRETTNGTVDYLNSDSDGDGCSDANEAYNNDTVDGLGDTYYNPNNLTEPLTLSSGAVDVYGKVNAATYTTGDVPKVTDGEADIAICNPCLSGATKGIPTENDPDGDGINNDCDLDDDNDGILDVDENACQVPDDISVAQNVYHWSRWTGTPERIIQGVISDGTFAPINIEAETVSGNNNLHVNQMYFYCDGNQSNPGRGYSNSANVPVGSSKAIAISVNPNNTVTIRFTFENGIAIDPLIHLTSFSGGAAGENVSNIVSFDKPFSIVDQCWTVKNGNSVTGSSNMTAGRNEPNATLLFSGNHSTITMTIRRPNAIAGDAIFFSVGTRGFEYDESFCVPTADGDDKDQDGIINRLDLDSDNDGIYDIVEAGIGSFDTNSDGRIDDMDNISVNVDIDYNGLSDEIELIYGEDKGVTPRETTNGVYDYLNSDSDGDGCSDANEAYNDASIDGVGDTYYNPSGLPEPLTQTSGAVDNNGKVIIATYDTGDIPAVIDNDALASVCNNNTNAINDFVNTNVNQPVSGNVLTNDFDLQGHNQAINGTLITNVSNGTVTINPNGSFTYTPNSGFIGEDSFIYEVCDDQTPSACATAQVFIEVLPAVTAGDEPPIANIDTGITKVDTTLTGNVLSNDYDPDGDPLQINTVPEVNTTNGTVTINPDGSYTYVPNTGFIGVDSFEYTVCDNTTPTPLCDTAVVTIHVMAGDENITVANDDAYFTVADIANNQVSGNVLDNDFDPEGDAQTVNTALVTTVQNGSLTFNADGSFEYTPNSNFFGQDSFTYEVCDDGTPQACDQATVIIMVAEFLPPDYYPTLFTSRTIVNGPSAVIDFVVYIGEANNQLSNVIEPVEVWIVDNDRFTFSIDPITELNGYNVHNADWTYQLEGGYHKFIYIGNGGLFPGHYFSGIGVKAIFNSPDDSKGTTPLTVIIKSNSGGEINDANNIDQDIIRYNNK